MRNIFLIIGREYRERVLKKSFLIVTFLFPLLMIALTVAPTLIMIYGNGDAEQISVLDNSGVVAPKLESNELISFKIVEGDLQDNLKKTIENEDFGLLYIGENITSNPTDIQLYTTSSSSMAIEENLRSKVEQILENYNIEHSGIENLQQVMDKIKVDVNITAIRTDKDDNNLSATIGGIMGMALGFVLYMIMVIYGSIVMSSVIEEKNSRVLDLLVTSVKPFDLMMGKILGVTAVALTQLAIWGITLFLLIAVCLPLLMPDDIASALTAVQSGITEGNIIEQSGFDFQTLSSIASVTDVAYMGNIITYLVLFMFGGLLLYAAMYGAVGASVDNVQDSQQLSTIITIPVIAALVVCMMVMSNPNSPLVIWCSYIPFTSPVVMLARIPCGIPTWQILVSLVTLYATFIVMIWLAGRIYRVGIFNHGSKVTLKDWWKWIRY